MGIERIALTGPMYAGKSTLAQALEQEGYMYINYSDSLKAETAEALEVLGHHTSVDEMNENKAAYRALLQALGPLEYNANPEHVMRALRPWLDAGRPRAVFDNVRGMQEYHILKSYGFTIVVLDIPLIKQSDRASALGVSLDEFLKARQAPIEQFVGISPDLTLDGTKDPQTNVRFLMGEKEYNTITLTK